MSQALKLDLNNPVFQKQLFDLAKEKQLSVFKTLRNLSNMTWNQVYQDQGLKWELVYSCTGPTGSVFTACGLARVSGRSHIGMGNG